MENSKTIQCYNRGCGQKYNPEENADDSCCHHPGQPVFHDAYKGWSCCNKKCTDFTEFLNIKGCKRSKHCNDKPPQPEKPPVKNVPVTEVVEIKPILPSVLVRPAFNTPMVTMKPEVAPSLKQASILTQDNNKVENHISTSIPLGTICKNRGCNVSYEGPVSDNNSCVYHPGVPIFHEGLKFWSCCQKRTTDFNAFLNQVGCGTGNHLWIKEENNSRNVQCRWDWHQTGSHVVISIYAKQYCPNTSLIQLNPVRVYANIIFPQQSGHSFTLDVELRGIIKVEASQVSMYGTKVELKLKKAEPGSWPKLEAPRVVSGDSEIVSVTNVENVTSKVESVDLSDV